MTLHHGSCHCGQVKFTLKAKISRLTHCDCSLCRMRNAVMTAVHENRLEVTQGRECLTLYQWNTKVAEHYFCRRCGIYVFHRKRALPDHFGVNVYCLHDFDPSTMTVEEVDGKGMTLVAGADQGHWPGERC